MRVWFAKIVVRCEDEWDVPRIYWLWRKRVPASRNAAGSWL